LDIGPAERLTADFDTPTVWAICGSTSRYWRVETPRSSTSRAHSLIARPPASSSSRAYSSSLTFVPMDFLRKTGFTMCASCLEIEARSVAGSLQNQQVRI
jgi:hypothetical protein